MAVKDVVVFEGAAAVGVTTTIQPAVGVEVLIISFIGIRTAGTASIAIRPTTYTVQGYVAFATLDWAVVIYQTKIPITNTFYVRLIPLDAATSYEYSLRGFQTK